MIHQVIEILHSIFGADILNLLSLYDFFLIYCPCMTLYEFIVLIFPYIINAKI